MVAPVIRSPGPYEPLPGPDAEVKRAGQQGGREDHDPCIGQIYIYGLAMNGAARDTDAFNRPADAQALSSLIADISATYSHIFYYLFILK